MTRSTEKPLNAGELIALLQQFPEDTPVMITRVNGKF